ncbi:uncharacterized protein LOC117178956 [Belonocnema kinseyi]|uniref:uncharacterized protein LOC117178956 n=1 Tax=Belonocnema kinseyi TaxID=2817044 RepID=UPI00143D5E9E|nr:uncharacterized protein LOC117178956 [Belonocnema kinseyi]
MRFAGTLLFALAVHVNSTVCFNREPSPPPDAFPVTRTFRLDSDKYNGLYFWDLNTGFQPLSGAVTFVVKGDTIVGRGIRNVIYPIYDSERHVIVIEAGQHKRVSSQRGNSYGLFSTYYISRPEPRPQPPRFYLISASEANLSDLHYFPGNSRRLISVSGNLKLVERSGTNTIIGWYANHFIHPLYDGKEHLIVQNTATGMNKEITPNEGVEFGVYSRIPVDPPTYRNYARRTAYRVAHGQTSDSRFVRSINGAFN